MAARNVLIKDNAVQIEVMSESRTEDKYNRGEGSSLYSQSSKQENLSCLNLSRAAPQPTLQI